MKKKLCSSNPIFNGILVCRHGLPHTYFFSDCKGLQPLHTTVTLTRKYTAVVKPKGKLQTASLFRFIREFMAWLNFNQSYVNQRDFFNLPLHKKGCRTCSSLALGSFNNLDPKNSRSCLQRFISIAFMTENSCHKVPVVYLNRPGPAKSRCNVYILSLLPSVHRCILLSSRRASDFKYIDLSLWTIENTQCCPVGRCAFESILLGVCMLYITAGYTEIYCY